MRFRALLSLALVGIPFVAAAETTLSHGLTKSDDTIPAGPEFRIGHAVLGPSVHIVGEPVVGGGPHGFLVVWKQGWNPEIRAARVNRDGSPLDIFGFVLPADESVHVRLVFWNGSEYVVVANVAGGSAIVRVSEQGVVLDPAWQRIAPSAIDFAWSGSRLLVVAYTEAGPEVVVLDGDGNRIVGPKPLAVPGSFRTVSTNGSSFLALSIAYSFDEVMPGLYATPISAQGEVTGNSRIIHPDAPNGSDLSSDGQNYLVMVRALGHFVLIALDENATQLGEPNAIESSAEAAGPVWTGSSYLVLHRRNGVNLEGELASYQINRDGSLRSIEVVASARDVRTSLRFAWNGSEGLALWQWQFSHFEVASVNDRGQRADGHQNRGTPLTLSLPLISRPSSACGAGVCLVGWSEGPAWAGQSPLKATLVLPDGAPLDGIAMDIDDSLMEQTLVRIVWNGENFLVIWSRMQTDERSDLVAKRVSPQGQLLDREAFRIATVPRYGNFHVSSDGSNALVVWSDSITDQSEIRGARITRSGVVLDPEGIRLIYSTTVPSAGTKLAHGAPVITFGPGHYLVVWNEIQYTERDCAPAQCAEFARNSVLAARVSPDGVLLDPVSRVLIHPQDRRSLSVSDLGWSGRRYAFVWNAYDARAQTGLPSGFQTVSTDLEITSPAQEIAGSNPVLAYNGTHFLVSASRWEGIPLYRFEPTGELESRFLNDSPGAYNPSFARSNRGTLLLYLKPDPTVGGNVRIFGRVLPHENRRRPILR